MFIVSKNRVWRRFTNALFDGWAPEPMPAGNEFMHWRGGKIPVALWQTILCFFLEHKTDEVQVRLYYNTQSRQWGAHAFPQRYPCGMTTKELEDHPNMATDLALFPDPWAYMGTVHHHCSSPAFQSGTDHSNETGIIGIHITVGNLNQAILDLHGRVCMKFPGELDNNDVVIRPGVQQFYEAPNWSDWFELPAPVAAVLPPAMHESILTTLLKTPVGKEVGFPARWAENLIRFCPTPATPGQAYYGGRRWDEGEEWSHFHREYDQSQFRLPSYGNSGAGARTVQSRNHLTPRGQKKPATTAGAIKEGGKGSHLPSAKDIDMNEQEHNWLLNTIIELMDPLWASAGSGVPVANHLDVESSYQLMEFATVSDARTTIEKMGFVRTLAGTYCHPEELDVINRTLNESIDRARNAAPPTPSIPIPHTPAL